MQGLGLCRPNTTDWAPVGWGSDLRGLRRHAVDCGPSHLLQSLVLEAKVPESENNSNEKGEIRFNYQCRRPECDSSPLLRFLFRREPRRPRARARA